MEPPCALSVSPPVLSLDQDQEVVGSLKVSVEAAKALTGIYREFHRKSASQEEEDISGEKEEEEDEKQKVKEESMQLLDYDGDSDL